MAQQHTHVTLSLQRRLERWELDHLRELCAVQAEEIERLKRNLIYAEDCAEMWQRGHERLAEHLDDQHAVGLTVGGEIVVVEGGAAHESTDNTALTHKAVEALRNRAITGLLINADAAVTPTSEAGFNFWNGYAKALQDLSDGTGATLSAKDARLSGYEVPRYFQGAFAALAVHTEPLTLAKVQQVLAAHGVQIPIDSVADGQINAGQQLENSAGMVIDLNDDHAAAAVDGDDGSLHGGASLAATVAQEGGAA